MSRATHHPHSLSTSEPDVDSADFTLDTLLRARQRAQEILSPKSDEERRALFMLFNLQQTSNLTDVAYTYLPGPSKTESFTLRYGPSKVVQDMANLIDGAILAEELHPDGSATDAYLYEEQAPITVPAEWLTELRSTKVVQDEGFELPWADG